MLLEICIKKYLNEIKTKWQELQNIPNIFAYTLSVEKSKYLPGEQQFYMELNPHRSALRRAPQTIPSLDTKFDAEKFNFTKVQPLELLLKIPYNGCEISMIINRSPLTKYHTLICPNVTAQLPQRITMESLSFAVTFLREAEDANFRIGYNSPGALASVNHLHLHLLYLNKDLYIDKAKLLPLAEKAYVCRLSEQLHTQAICFLIYAQDAEEAVAAKLAELLSFINWLCEQQIPHNLYLAAERISTESHALKIFIYAREEFCVVKNTMSFNLGFCELSGYIPIGDVQLYENLTQQNVLSKIENETGAVFNRIYAYFTKE